jgi:vacuolar-type H+-ATPase subunit F/Vma7
LNRIIGILRGELAAGFALTGIDVAKVRDSSSAWELLQHVIADGQHGLVIVDECFMSEIEERARVSLYERNVPLIVPVPCELRWRDVEELPPDDYLAGLIRRAVGYQLNLRL